MAVWNHDLGAKLARVVTSFRAGLQPSASGSCAPASPPRTYPQANVSIFAKSAPVLEHQHHRRRERSLSKTWTWRRHVDARAGESGGRSAHYDGDGHVSRTAAPSDHQSSFSYTCCPYAAYLPLITVERSEERLNILYMPAPA